MSKIWRTHKGIEIPINEIEDGHLLNCIKMIDRGYAYQLGKVDESSKVLYPDLFEEAKKWVAETNNKYGILEHYPGPDNIFIRKTAHLIHKTISPSVSRSVMMRVCAENIGLMQRFLNEDRR